MSKKRNGKKVKPGKRQQCCERCGRVARTSTPVGEPPSWAYKAGTFGRPQEGELKTHSPEVAFELAQKAGIVDAEGNLMPGYR